MLSLSGSVSIPSLQKEHYIHTTLSFRDEQTPPHRHSHPLHPLLRLPRPLIPDGIFDKSQTGCTCHGEDPDLNQNVTPHLDGLDTPYQPGETYNLTIWIEGGPEPAAGTASKGGFGLSVTAGTLAPIDPDLVKVEDEVKATHTSDGSRSGRTWEVAWTAPAEGGGLVTFYLAVNSVNGDGWITGDSWDRIEVSSEEIPEFPSLVLVPLILAASIVIVLGVRKKLSTYRVS